MSKVTLNLIQKATNKCESLEKLMITSKFITMQIYKALESCSLNENIRVMNFTQKEMYILAHCT